MSASEVLRFFCSLGLETEEKRREMLSLATIGNLNLKTPERDCKTWLSGDTKEFTGEDKHAGLE